MDISEINYEGLLRLRNAIVEQAAKDYVIAKRKLLAHPELDLHRTAAYGECMMLERWFLSTRYSDLVPNISGQWMLDRLNELAAGKEIKITREMVRKED